MTPISIKKEWLQITGLVLLGRLAYALIGLRVMMDGGPLPLNEPIYQVVAPLLRDGFFAHWFVNPWFQWDTLSYLDIAVNGYRNPSSSVAFMPLYPFLIRLLTPLTGGDALLAGLLLSTFFTISTLILLYELVSALYYPRLAIQSVLAMAVFPTAFYLLAVYTEALFLTLVLGSWLMAHQRRWGWACLLAGFAALARLQGILLTPVLLWLMLVSLLDAPDSKPMGQIRQVVGLLRQPTRLLTYRWEWLVAFLPVLVGAAYQAWLAWAGYPTVAETLRQYWKIETVAPWAGVWMFVQRLAATQTWIYMDGIELFLLALVLVALVVITLRMPPAFSLYAWLTLAVLFMRGTPPHLLASYSRYYLAIFPIFILLAQVKNRLGQRLLFIFSFLLQCLLGWVFLSGSWVA